MNLTTKQGGIIMFNDMTTIEILKLLAPVIIIELSLAIFCLYKLTKDKVKYLPKWAWALIILFANLLGPIIYLMLGRERD
jgi:hypothetical protein